MVQLRSGAPTGVRSGPKGPKGCGSKPAPNQGVSWPLTSCRLSILFMFCQPVGTLFFFSFFFPVLFSCFFYYCFCFLLFVSAFASIFCFLLLLLHLLLFFAFAFCFSFCFCFLLLPLLLLLLLLFACASAFAFCFCFYLCFFFLFLFFAFCFCFCFCWECFRSTGSSRKGRGQSTKASVTERARQ